MRDAVGESVPDGKLVVFTVTAPIRLPSETASALEESISRLLASRRARGKLEDVIHGNHIRIWLVPAGDVTSKAIGLVHNPGPSAEVLLATALSESRGG